ncbi:MAG: tripartite tricarboxylate transporter substrate binding protein [Burkholderiales bacterium]|nr:tripartite tricarboxylate transporter substrate binding protein [Burkholderiales bacterium]
MSRLPLRLLSLATRCGLLLGLACGLAPAFAQAYPNKPIRFIVGFAPGSSIDSVARILADHIRSKTGQPVTVDNRTGANGMLAATELVKAAPDGHTVLISNSSTITVNPLVYKKIAYDVERDLAPVALTVSVPFILTTNPDKDPGIHTLADLMKAAKARPGQMLYGSAGVGNLTQLSFEMLNHQAGVKMVHVPYRGSAPAQLGLLGKEVDAAFDNPAAMPQIRAGKLRAIAVSSAQRWRDLPEVPTIAEQGYAGFDISFWVGAFVPAATPPAVVKALYDIIRTAGDEAAPKALLQQQGNLLMLDPKQFAARIRQETDAYAEIVKRGNITLE